MNSRLLLGIFVISAACLVSASGFAQAAAESALANSASGAAASKSGSALGQGLNRLTGGLGQRLSDTVQTPPTNPASAKPASKAVPASATTPTAAPDSSPFVITVQGLGNCAGTPNSKGNECLAKDASAKKPAQDKYKSVINLE